MFNRCKINIMLIISKDSKVGAKSDKSLRSMCKFLGMPKG